MTLSKTTATTGTRKARGTQAIEATPDGLSDADFTTTLPGPTLSGIADDDDVNLPTLTEPVDECQLPREETSEHIVKQPLQIHAPLSES